ncbi:MAG: IS110 family transposase, partial [Bacteroidales bacterium]|nr:IS110 family transposase [Bacteroidales bacterium]
FIRIEKTDSADAFLIADFARVGRTKKHAPWRGSQFIALRHLTRHRMHLSEAMWSDWEPPPGDISEDLPTNCHGLSPQLSRSCPILLP